MCEYVGSEVWWGRNLQVGGLDPSSCVVWPAPCTRLRLSAICSQPPRASAWPPAPSPSPCPIAAALCPVWALDVSAREGCASCFLLAWRLQPRGGLLSTSSSDAGLWEGWLTSPLHPGAQQFILCTPELCSCLCLLNLLPCYVYNKCRDWTLLGKNSAEV